MYTNNSKLLVLDILRRTHYDGMCTERLEDVASRIICSLATQQNTVAGLDIHKRFTETIGGQEHHVDVNINRQNWSILNELGKVEYLRDTVQAGFRLILKDPTFNLHPDTKIAIEDFVRAMRYENVGVNLTIK